MISLKKCSVKKVEKVDRFQKYLFSFLTIMYVVPFLIIFWDWGTEKNMGKFKL